MSIDIDLDRFPGDILIPTLEYFKKYEIECNIIGAKYLVDNMMYEEIMYLLDQGCITIDDFMAVYDYEEDPEAVKFLIKIKMTRAKCYGKLLIDYIEENNMEILKSMIRIHPDILAYLNHEHGKPLIIACQIGNIDIVKFLIHNGAYIDCCEHDPIIDALQYENTDVADYLLLHGSRLRSIKPHHIEKIFDDNYIDSINYIINKINKSEMNHLLDMDWLPCLKNTVHHGNIEILLQLTRNGASILKHYRELKKIARHNKLMKSYLRIIKKSQKNAKKRAKNQKKNNVINI